MVFCMFGFRRLWLFLGSFLECGVRLLDDGKPLKSHRRSDRRMSLAESGQSSALKAHLLILLNSDVPPT